MNCWKKKSNRACFGEEEKAEIMGETTIASVGIAKSNYSSHHIDQSNVSIA